MPSRQLQDGSRSGAGAGQRAPQCLPMRPPPPAAKSALALPQRELPAPQAQDPQHQSSQRRPVPVRSQAGLEVERSPHGTERRRAWPTGHVSVDQPATVPAVGVAAWGGAKPFPMPDVSLLSDPQRAAAAARPPASSPVWPGPLSAAAVPPRPASAPDRPAVWLRPAALAQVPIGDAPAYLRRAPELPHLTPSPPPSGGYLSPSPPSRSAPEARHWR